MVLVEQACIESNIDFNWFRENVLKPYNELKINGCADEKKVKTIMKRALKILYDNKNHRNSHLVNVVEFNWESEDE